MESIQCSDAAKHKDSGGQADEDVDVTHGLVWWNADHSGVGVRHIIAGGVVVTVGVYVRH